MGGRFTHPYNTIVLQVMVAFWDDVSFLWSPHCIGDRSFRTVITVPPYCYMALRIPECFRYVFRHPIRLAVNLHRADGSELLVIKYYDITHAALSFALAALMKPMSEYALASSPAAVSNSSASAGATALSCSYSSLKCSSAAVTSGIMVNVVSSLSYAFLYFFIKILLNVLTFSGKRDTISLHLGGVSRTALYISLCSSQLQGLLFYAIVNLRETVGFVYCAYNSPCVALNADVSNRLLVTVL